jgi:broad-specificity NMP kinase
MTKTCVFITGTNATGKTTLAKELQRRFGGLADVTPTISNCADNRICFAGKYDGRKYGGVDSLNSTRVLAEIVERALQSHDVIICEGSYLHTFGNNLTNAIFKAERNIVILLYAPLQELNKRLIARSGAGVNVGIANKQKTCARSFAKWKSIGVEVRAFDTSKENPGQIAEAVIQLLNL